LKRKRNCFDLASIWRHRKTRSRDCTISTRQTTTTWRRRGGVCFRMGLPLFGHLDFLFCVLHRNIGII
jgi:hypothetical protein